MKILIAEDDTDIREALVFLLESEGYETVEARNGKEALAFLNSGGRPNLILLDLFMPIMDGFEFRREQLANTVIAEIPVIVMSADMHWAEKKEQTKVAHYFKKPLNVDELLVAIKSELQSA